MLTEDEPNEDPFQQARSKAGVMTCPFQGETITMLLKHSDVRRAAADWQQFSSDAPFRVPIPSEERVRSTRQLPIEIDPPLHAEYRAITDPYFQRAKQPEVIAAVKKLIDSALSSLTNRRSIEAVAELALPVQSKALTHLLNMPESEAETWIKWGIHVFHPATDELKTGDALENYLQEQFDRAEAHPGNDFFSALVTANFQGRKLTRDECIGFGNLTFAGGRDTIIHTITSIIAWFADNPDALQCLREDPRRIVLASEEFFRVFMPLTQIGRVCPEGAEIHGAKVKPDHRIGLCWASANFDESVFEDSHRIRLDRRPNPHMSFGFRNHLCQGAAHARLVVRSLLESMCEQCISIQVLDGVRHVEHEKTFTRAIGYDRLMVRLSQAVNADPTPQ